MGTKNKPSITSITDCTFVGVQFDAKSVESISIIANALLENARALATLSSVFRAQGVHIECLMKVNDANSGEPR